MARGHLIMRTALAVVAWVPLPAVVHGQAADGGTSDGNGSVSSDALVADVLAGEAAQGPQRQQSPPATLPSVNAGDSAKPPTGPSAEATASGASTTGGASPPAPPLYETVVTASAREETIFQSPRSVNVVKRTDNRNGRTTPELLLEQPGIFVQRTNYGGGAPVIRGHLGNRILILVDGIRLNNSATRGGPNQSLNLVDPMLVNRIEVVRGPGAALYGSDAIGGVINVITWGPRVGGSGDLNATARVAGGTADRSGQVGLRLDWSGERVGASATASYRSFGDLRMSDDYPQRFTGYDEWSVAAGAAWRPASAHTMLASYQSTRQYDVPRSDRSTPTDFRLFSRQTRQLAYLRYTVDLPGTIKRLRWTASFGDQSEVQDRYRVTRNAREQDATGVGTIGGQFELTADLGRGGKLNVGADFYGDIFDSHASAGPLVGELTASPQSDRYPEGVGYMSGGIFASHTLPLGSRWSLMSQGRLGAVHSSLPEDDRLALLFPDANLGVLPARAETVMVYAGGLHLRRTLTSWAAVHAGASLGFRAPNIDDYARLGVEGPGYVIPSRDLRPERALSGEIGVKATGRGADVSVTYAYTYVDDALGRQPASIAGMSSIDGVRVVQVANADAARFHSIEFGARTPIWRRLTAFGNVSYTRGEQETLVVPADPAAPPETMVEPSTKTPPLFGAAGLGWYATPSTWFVESVLRFSGEQTRLSATDLSDTRICPDVPGRCVGTPGWAVLSLRAGYRLGTALRAVLVLDNLTDARYRPHASGIEGAGFGASAFVEGSL